MKILTIITFTACLFTACHQAEKPAKTEKIKINHNGVNIAYTDNGRGDTTLLFVHGWCINKSYWDDQIPYFDKNYRVVAIDLPGFGQSGKNREEFNTRVYAADINQVIDRLKLKHVILIGHSMAGDIVLQAAVNDPARITGFVGIDNFKSVGIKPADEKKAKKEYEDAMEAMRKNFKSIALPYVNQQLFCKTTSSKIKKRVLNDVLHADTVIAVQTIAQDKYDETEQLFKFKKKLYLLNSDYDPTDLTGLNEKHLPYDITYIHATGHFPMVEKPDEFNKLLAGIIKKM